MERAYRLLSQLPATAVDILEALPFSPVSLHDYHLQASEYKRMVRSVPESHWFQLRVTHHVNDLVLRCALHAAVIDLDRHTGPMPGGPFIDSIFTLLKLALENSAKGKAQDPRWLVVCIYLWTSWQRCLMLYLWSQMMCQLGGYDYENNRLLHLKGTEAIPEIYKFLNRQHLQQLSHTAYLCGWSFRSLQNDRASISMDLRHFSDCFHALFGERLPTCNPGPTQCNGSSSQDCKRFKNTEAPEVRNQSAHDYKCKGSCPRLFWSRHSFMRVSGARAVDIASTKGETLRYCKVIENTLTISHVWSHGQGGRPENTGPEGTGFNRCLHRRYAELAASLGCKSYWMDTPCIPSEKDLRWECVSQITSVFATSAKTLICDKDVMTIDISKHTINAYESVLATLLVCDWSVRAWTLLEAMRGRAGLYILCLQNRIISLEKLLKSVHAKGRIDLVTLFLGRGYLFPPAANTYFDLFPGEPITSELEQEMEDGFLSISEAAASLSHRHATRDGDDLLIWSLLIGNVEDESPVEMWKRQVGKRITTGSLISSAQRVQGHAGLSWAPYLPTVLKNIREPGSIMSTKVYPAYDGSETSKGVIFTEGLRAKWLVHRIPNLSTTPERASSSSSSSSSLSHVYAKIATHYLRGFKFGVLLQAVPYRGPRDIAVRYRGVLGQVMVICGSHDEAAWEWKGIYEWDDGRIPLPPFELKEMLII